MRYFFSFDRVLCTFGSFFLHSTRTIPDEHTWYTFLPLKISFLSSLASGDGEGLVIPSAKKQPRSQLQRIRLLIQSNADASRVCQAVVCLIEKFDPLVVQPSNWKPANSFSVSSTPPPSTPPHKTKIPLRRFQWCLRTDVFAICPHFFPPRNFAPTTKKSYSCPPHNEIVTKSISMIIFVVIYADSVFFLVLCSWWTELKPEYFIPPHFSNILAVSFLDFHILAHLDFFLSVNPFQNHIQPCVAVIPPKCKALRLLFGSKFQGFQGGGFIFVRKKSYFFEKLCGIQFSRCFAWKYITWKCIEFPTKLSTFRKFAHIFPIWVAFSYFLTQISLCSILWFHVCGGGGGGGFGICCIWVRFQGLKGGGLYVWGIYVMLKWKKLV